MMELKFYKSPWKAIRLMLLGSPFVIFSLYSIITHNIHMSLAVSWGALCFFGLCIPMGLFNLFDKRPAIVINSEGIFSRLLYSIFNKKTDRGFIKWDSMRSAYLKDLNVSAFSKQKFLCLVLDPGAPILSNANQTLIKFSENLGFQGISIPLHELKKYDWEKLVVFLNSMSDVDSVNRQKLLLNYEP